MRPLLVLLARGNLVMALSMAAATWLAQVLAGLPAEPLPPFIAFLVIYSIYSLDRVTELDADSRTHPERARFSQRHAGLIRGSALAAYALALGLAGRRGAWCVAVTLLPLAALLVYSFPFLPRAVAHRVGFSRLKEVFVLKNVWVAGTLAATPVLLAGVFHGAVRNGKPLVATGVFLLGRWAVNVILFDVRDEAGDRANGLRTIPVVLGRARTLRLLHGINVLLVLLALAVPLFGLASPRFALLGVSCLYAWVYLRRVERTEDIHFLCDVVSDGELLVLAGVVLLVTWLPGL
ncbi:UbiA family prenyltransferase [Archangium lansingense]|uniref:UbiA family prenyltransferase n=1 Tax=Archangium lansingense TaxID=2995310 RepID=A0ABT4ANI7_9BACT|nr:UbiA family prenyltransferase [Archangium lansinium]MCY1083230.1 UbiA family prenyltransferase [Archangium lansinium]